MGRSGPGIFAKIRTSNGRPSVRPTPRLVVVSNRLPASRVASGGRAHWQAGAGGLVTALKPVVKRTRGIWIGWSGSTARSPRSSEYDGITMRAMGLSPRELQTYYHGFCNRTLWPLFHDAIRPPEFKHEHWRPYVDINRRFARAAVRAARNGDLVWVHDYHLMLAPAMIREMNPSLRVGFFLHIPFPPEELFEWLPWRRELLEGLLGADVVGFQTHLAAQNFSRLARRYTDTEGTDTVLRHNGRKIVVQDFPISIDFDWFDKRAKEPRVQKMAAAIRSRVGPRRKILLAVDRLDYTKGIDARLHAFQLLLDRSDASVNNCVLIQIAAPSREAVLEYEQTRELVDGMVGRINGQHSSPGRVAVHYFRRTFSREDLVPYYLAADAMLVTPLRDGMNLVAKEFVASRTDLGGVLVLSEFAGAAQEMRQALLVNPRDTEGVATAMHEALTLNRDDARFRMGFLRQRVRRHDVHHWAENFLSELAP